MQVYDQFPEFQEHAGILDNKFKILKTIGQGRYAKVKLAIDISENKKYAIKIMKESDNITVKKIENFINEVKILASIKHKNIIKLQYVSLMGVYKKPDGSSQRVMYYVMKIAEYGELYQMIDSTTNFPEKIARYFFHQLITGIELIHNREIAHRDIKTENILIDHNFNIKICDFGFSCKSTDSQDNKKAFDSRELVGSPEYNPPELTNYSHYNTHYFADEMDLFASGVVLFLMVVKSAPFQTTSQQDPYYQRLCRKDKSAYWKIFQGCCQPTNEFKDLIEKMLALDPEGRLTLEQIKQHQWYQGEVPSEEELKQEMQERSKEVINRVKDDLERKREKLFQKLDRQKPYLNHNNNNNQNSMMDHEEMISKYKYIIEEVNSDIERFRQRKIQQKKSLEEQQQKQSQDNNNQKEQKDPSPQKMKKNNRRSQKKQSEEEYLKQASGVSSSCNSEDNQDDQIVKKESQDLQQYCCSSASLSSSGECSLSKKSSKKSSCQKQQMKLMKKKMASGSFSSSHSSQNNNNEERAAIKNQQQAEEDQNQYSRRDNYYYDNHDNRNQ